MNKVAKRILLIAIGVDVLVIGATLAAAFCFVGFIPLTTSTNEADNHNPLAEQDMLQTTLEWGRLAPLPEARSDFQIQTEGSAFTREFRSSFTTTKEDLDAWVQASPGLQDATVETIDDHTKRYAISPGGGAQFAEAIIDLDKCLVQIHVYWS